MNIKPDFRSLQQLVANVTRTVTNRQQVGDISGSAAEKLMKELGDVAGRLRDDAFGRDGLTNGPELQKAIEGLQRAATLAEAAKPGDRIKGALDLVAKNQTRGLLSKGEADVFSMKLSALRSQYSMPNGTPMGRDGMPMLSPDQQLQFNASLNRLRADIARKSTDNAFDPQMRLANFSERIAAGLKDGSLTAAQHATLTTALEGLTAQTNEKGATPAGLEAAFKALNQQIFDARHDTDIDFDARVSSLRERASAVTDPQKAEAFRAELSDLVNREETMGDSPNIAAMLNEISQRMRSVRLNEVAIRG